jgi:hypothetical protein
MNSCAGSAARLLTWSIEPGYTRMPRHHADGMFREAKDTEKRQKTILRVLPKGLVCCLSGNAKDNNSTIGRQAVNFDMMPWFYLV